MDIVIAGAGNTGTSLIKFYNKQHTNITVIDTDAERIAFMHDNFDVLAVQGSCLSHYILRSTGLMSCDLFIASTNDDSVNIVSCQLAKRLGAKKTVARIVSENIFPSEVFELEDHFGIDWLISPNFLAGSSISAWLQSNCTNNFEHYFLGRLKVIKIPITANSNWIDKSIKKIKCYKHTKLIAIIKQGNIIPLTATEDNDTLKIKIELNDEIILCGLENTIQKTLSHNYSHGLLEGSKQIFIAGSNRSVLSILSKIPVLHKRITVFEKSKAICQRIEEQYGVRVIHLDYSDIEALKQQDLSNSKAFICGSRNDSENLMLAFHAQAIGLPNILPIVETEDKKPLFQNIAIKNLIVTNELVEKELEHYFNPNFNEAFDFIQDEKIKAITKFIDENSITIGKNANILIENGYSDDTLIIVAIMRHSTFIIENEEIVNTILKADDKVLIASIKGKTENLKKILQK